MHYLTSASGLFAIPDVLTEHFSPSSTQKRNNSLSLRQQIN